jgi:short-subunit dehydrogenase
MDNRQDRPNAVSKGTALVTGASRGIGYELARLFAGTGYDVVLVARSEDDLREASDYFEDRFDVEATTVPTDLADPDAPRELYETCADRGIEVDALVNNAGFGTAGSFLDTDLQAELDEIQVNVTAVTHLTKLFARDMADRGEGKLLNVASSAGFVPGPRMAVYYATKSYVLSFSEAIAEELDDDGVTVSCLCPGPISTGFQERADVEDKTLNRLFLSDDVRSVARAGYRGLMRGDTVVTPGIGLKLGLFGARLAPRSVTRKLVNWLNS